MGGLFSKLTKGLGSIMNPTSLLDLGDSGNAALDFLDPGNTFHQGNADRLANKQFAMEYDIAKKNYESQEKWNEKNFTEQQRMNNFNILQQQQAFDYQRQLNAMQMQREDTATQRRVADLKAAGLSPTLAAGSAASATPVHAGTAPQGVAPQGVAPQMGTPSDVKVRQAMFKEQMERDYMQMAIGLMSNMADISRTKAETELIAAQKNKLVQETPVDLRLKELDQEYRESTLETRIAQAVQEETKKGLEILNSSLNARLSELTAGEKAYNLVIMKEQAKVAPQKYASETDLLKEQVKEKAYAVKLAEQVYNYQETTGVPISAMSPVAKTFNPMTSTWSKKIKEGSLGREPSWQPKVRNALSNFWKKVQKGIGADYSVSGHGASRSF